MQISYVPMIAAKQGEFKALKNLHASIADKIYPLFDLPAQKASSITIEKSIARTAIAAGKAWAHRPAFLDISKWSPDAKTETGLHVLEYAFSQFLTEGVLVNPVVGYDRRSDRNYITALKNLRAQYSITPCIRFDKDALKDDFRDEDYFVEEISGLLEEISLQPTNCYALLDFRDTSSTTIPDMVEDAENAIGVLRKIGFRTIIVVGGSMPATVDGAVRERDSQGCVTRVEMLAWKTIFASSGDMSTVFGDYPIRNPDAADGIIALDANAKIRYTIGDQFFVVRGHTKREDSLTNQHRELAKKLISSVHYANPQASWGDAELQLCALGLKNINEATTMIAIDTNRHISTVVSEIFEHQVALHAKGLV